MRMSTTKPIENESGHCHAYAAIETAIEAPATANCVVPNPSNGLTRNAFSLRRTTPTAMTNPESIRGKNLPLAGADEFSGESTVIRTFDVTEVGGTYSFDSLVLVRAGGTPADQRAGRPRSGLVGARASRPLVRTRLACASGLRIPPVSDVETLRNQLRERGYLGLGIERWFALDPWSSRAFWLELITVSLKGATLVALVGVLPLVAVMLFRNHPLSVSETFLITLMYGAAWLVVAFASLVGVALLFKSRPQLAVDTPRALLAISFAAAGALTFAAAFWWYRFDAAPSTAELAAGIALMALFFVVASIVVSAAMLSFSIYELQRVPAIHQKPRGVPMSIAAAVLIALLF